MNRRAFLTTAAMTPILASAFRPVRAQTAGGRLSGRRHVHEQRGGEQRHLRVAVRRGDGQGHVAGPRRGDRQSQLGRGPSQQAILVRRERAPAARGWRANRGGDGVLDRCRVGQADADRPRQDEGLAPAHMLVDPTGSGRSSATTATAPGSEGTSVAVFAIGADGKLAERRRHSYRTSPKPKRLDPAAPPPKNGNRRPPIRIACCCLRTAGSCSSPEKGFDEIVVYRFDAATGALDAEHPAAVEATKFGAAPRHLAFGKDGSSCTSAMRPGAPSRPLRMTREGHAEPESTPGDAAARCAADRLVRRDRGAPDGNYLYVSNRGHNSLALFAIDPSKGTLDLQGQFPVAARRGTSRSTRRATTSSPRGRTTASRSCSRSIVRPAC